MVNRDVGVIIAAAGSGERFGKPKQFELLGDHPIYLHVARTFSRIPSVHTIVIVTREEYCDEIRRGLTALNPPCAYRVISGGASRQDSVFNGLTALKDEHDISIAVVHDAARVLVTDSLIAAVIESARSHGSAIAALRVVDTLKRAREGGVVETVSREGLWRAQTPQAARMDVMLRAFEAARHGQYQGTDESELLERVGEFPRIVEGSELNFKVTYPGDLERARMAILQGR